MTPQLRELLIRESELPKLRGRYLDALLRVVSGGHKEFMEAEQLRADLSYTQHRIEALKSQTRGRQ